MPDSRQKILIIEDETVNIDVLIEIIGSCYKVYAAKNGEQGIERANRYLPDLILLDIILPGIDGYKVCSQLKRSEKTSHIPIIFVTAMTHELDETKGLELGAIDYITKPFNPFVVRARIENHMALIEAMKLREDVERMTRHDIKTPLNLVINMPNVLISEYELPKSVEKKLKMIREAGYKMLKMINLSLDMYKMESGTYELEARLVDLTPIVHKILEDLDDYIRSKKIAIEFQIMPGHIRPIKPFIIMGEELLCYSMLSNLIKNAIEASPPEQAVVILLGTDVKHRFSTIMIHNQGAVPEEIQQTFFNKYVTSGKLYGTGLGTYSANLIAQTLKGHIEMETSDQNTTKVTVYLPNISGRQLKAIESDANTLVDGVPTSPKNQGSTIPLHILLVEDNPHNRIVFGIYLKNSPHKIDTAQNGKIGFDKLTTASYDIIFMDLEMDVMNGYETTLKIRQFEREHQLRSTPIIAMTAHTFDDEQVKIMKAEKGFSDIVTKPFSKYDLYQTIEKYSKSK